MLVALRERAFGIDAVQVPVRELILRRHDSCVACGAELPAGTRAWWNRTSRTVTCTGCWPGSAQDFHPPLAPVGELEVGQPGASLDREYERRRSNRERRTQETRPHIGGLLLALNAVPQHELAFHQGAVAERAVADSLSNRTRATAVVTLHNRRMPSGRGDIDHIAVAPSGVYVIDTKDWRGKVEIQSPWLSAPKLLINGRERTTLIDGLERQIAAVRSALDHQGETEIPIHGALCFTRADLPLLRTQTIRGHLLLYRKALAKRLNAKGPLSPLRLEELARHLAAALPPGS